VTRWPYCVVPLADGSLATFHQGCEPWIREADDQQVGGLELLSDAERQLVVGVVHALVDREEEALRRVGAIADGLPDPYEPTRRWRLWDQVSLVMPPGDPLEWEADVSGSPDRGWAVDVRMWTAEEQGPSDLVLHLDVNGSRRLYRGMWT
jgi:hypothetical protein